MCSIRWCTVSPHGWPHTCSIRDQEERAATELQIREFGQGLGLGLGLGLSHTCSIRDQEERAATELQIREFGQGLGLGLGLSHTCSIRDQEERAATELQIREFGQTPRRLFVLPHPHRLSRHGDRVGGVVVEEEVRTVGATTEGLSRMDSSNSWGQSSLTSPSVEEHEWIHVDLPVESGKGHHCFKHMFTLCFACQSTIALL